MKNGRSIGVALSAGIATVGICSVSRAEADDLAKGLTSAKPATSGTTDVATSTFEAAQKADAKAKDTTEAKVSGGGLFTAGNAQSTSITSGATFRLRREENQLSAAAAANYATARPAGEPATHKTVENFQGKSRYDRFLTPVVVAFGAVSLRSDRFQGLDLRLNLDPGFAFYAVDTKTTQLWTEIGYDYQHDIRNQTALDAARLTDPTLPKTEDRHSGRLFFGYSDSFNKNVSLSTGLELLQALAHTENRRINWDISLSSAIAGKLSVANTFSLRYDHNPLPGIKTTDAIESVSLVYTLM
jgi:putative salt-induced outer membrane protein